MFGEKHGRRLILLRSGALGDLLLLRPALFRLREALPEWKVTLLAPGERGALLQDGVEQIFDLDRAEFTPLFGGVISPRSLLAHSSAETERVLIFLKENQPLRQAFEGIGVRFVTFCPPHPEEKSGCHATLHLWSAIAAATSGREPSLPLPGNPVYPPLLTGDREGAKEVLYRADIVDSSYAVIHPGSGSPHKNAPLRALLREMTAFQKQGIKHLCITAGEADGELGQELADLLPEARLLPSISLPVLAGLLHGASAYLGNDSGVSHLAAQCGVPVTVFFRHTDPALWRPWGPSVRVIRLEPESALSLPRWNRLF